jgi:hypothetical protein
VHRHTHQHVKSGLADHLSGLVAGWRGLVDYLPWLIADLPGLAGGLSGLVYVFLAYSRFIAYLVIDLSGLVNICLGVK